MDAARALIRLKALEGIARGAARQIECGVIAVSDFDLPHFVAALDTVVHYSPDEGKGR
jgi:hypothetical protein